MQQDSSPVCHFPGSSSFPTASAHPRVGCPSPGVCMDHRQTQMSFFPNINYQCWFWFLNLGKVPDLLKDIGDVNIPSGSSCHGVLGSNSLLPSLWALLPFWEGTDDRFINTWFLSTLLDSPMGKSTGSYHTHDGSSTWLSTFPLMHSSLPSPDELKVHCPLHRHPPSSTPVSVSLLWWLQSQHCFCSSRVIPVSPSTRLPTLVLLPLLIQVFDFHQENVNTNIPRYP